MISLVISRLASALVVILGVVCLVFSLVHIVPGDPVEVMIGESAYASDVDRERLRRLLGLDRPIAEQLGDYLAGLARLDLGESIHAGRPVSELIAERLPATAQLAFLSLLVALVLAVPLGALAALRRDGPWDHGAMGFAMIGVSIPNFVMGPLLVLVFSLWLGWFPVSGREGPLSVVLPALTLGSALAAILSRMIRSTLLEVLHEDFIRTARAKGAGGLRVLVRHAFPNAMLSLVTVLALQLGTLLGGAVITEIVFSWPGLGQLTVDAIRQRDYPVVQGGVLVIALAYVAVNSLTDIAYGWLDPRVRYAGGER